MHLPRLALPLAVAAAILAAAPAASAVRRAPCIPGTKKPVCHIWTGKVKAVDDGDTVNVKINGSRGQSKIRLTGIQAMELHKYGKRAGREGECTAVAATVLLERTIRRGRSKARIAALKPGSITGKRARLRRSIAVKIGGRWVDPAAEVLRAGLALWFPNAAEWPWNRKYAILAAKAARKGIGVWDPTTCGSAATALTMKVKWDAIGQDNRNVAGEWVRVTNTDPVTTVSLDGWWLRDSHLRPRYRFPRSAVLPPGGSLRVFVGRGSNTPDSFYWGLREAVFENVVGGRRAIGDGAYLFDRRGDLHAHIQYPCQLSCRDPAAGRVDVLATSRGTEYITIRNTSSEPLDLTHYEIENQPWFYEFPRGTVLAPGERLTLFILEGSGTGVVQSWGLAVPILNDRKDVVTLRNPLGAPVRCHAWGRMKCPRV